MKTLHALCLALPLVTGGCITEYSEGYGSSGYYGSPGVYRTYDNYPPAYYSSGYRRPYYPGSYGYNNYRYNQSDCEEDHRKEGSSKKKSTSTRDLRLVDYDQNRHKGDLPDGYHSPEWWKEHGYSLGQNTYKNREGEVKGKAAQQHKSSSSKSSSNKGSDTKSNSHDKQKYKKN